MSRPVDLGRPFLPEPLTPLYYTSAYRALTDAERLRYNQLQALYFNEQIAFFETAVGQNLLGALARDGRLGAMTASLRRFKDEEERHTAMFRRLNQEAAPHLYAHADAYFIRVPAAWARLLDAATRRPRLFPLFLWVMLLQEERSLYYSREVMRGRASLEPHFVDLHRAHLSDEVDHVRWDEELLDRLWSTSSRLHRRLNAGLFQWMVGEFFNTPKRAQLRVLDELAREHPRLQARLPVMRRQLLALAHDDAYRSSLYSRAIVPRVFARFDQWPEFRWLGLTIAGYRPQ
jgi:hypothetical protein